MDKNRWLQIRLSGREHQMAKRLAKELGTKMSVLVLAGLKYLDENRKLARHLITRDDNGPAE